MAKLYIVPTPIGNLDDITLRAVNVLREVDFILAEDTRTTSFLLKHLGIEQKLRSHHKFNEHATVRLVAESIAAGRDAALVSDAGTPGISDPGFLLVRTCVEAGIEVETLPGATALIPALYYTYTGCLGRGFLAVDIGVFLLSAAAAFLLDRRLRRRGALGDGWQQIAGLLLLWGVMFLFVYLSFRPGRIPLFRDPVTGGCGIPK